MKRFMPYVLTFFAVLGVGSIIASQFVPGMPPSKAVLPHKVAFLSEEFDEAMGYSALRKAESVGRPIGSKEWLANMEAKTGLTLAPQKPGPKRPATRFATEGDTQ